MRNIILSFFLVLVLFVPKHSYAARGYVLETDNGTITNGITLLATITGVNMKNTGQTTLYTVPTGKKCIITEIIAIPAVADAVTVNPDFGIGSAGGGYVDWEQFSGIDFGDTSIATSLSTESGDGGMAVFTSGSEIKLDVTVGATATTSTASFQVFGYLY